MRADTLTELNAKLGFIIEFGVFSQGTARRVFRGLAKGSEVAPLIRPRGPLLNSAYSPSDVSITKRHREYARSQLGMTDRQAAELRPHTLIVPREKGMSKKELKEAYKYAPKHVQEITSDPIAIAAHERGHAYGPRINASEVKNAANSNEEAKMLLAEERRANLSVLDQARLHGSPREVDAWKELAQKQIRANQSGMFSDVVDERPLSYAKKIYRTSPWFQKQASQFSARNYPHMKNPIFHKGMIQLNARIDHILEFGNNGGKPKSKVNAAGNYTKPGMRKALFKKIMASSSGGDPGEWSARKAQALAREYKAKGGGYKS